MEKTIIIKGGNPIDVQNRTASIGKINALPTKALSNLASLASNQKALKYLTDDKKFNRLKMFL